MPCLRILTNVPRSSIPKDFCERIMPVLVRTVRKPADKFICIISGDCLVNFGGDSSGPGVVATLESVGNVEPEDNKLITKELTDYIQKEIGVIPDRCFITFYDMKGCNIGRGGITH